MKVGPRPMSEEGGNEGVQFSYGVWYRPLSQAAGATWARARSRRGGATLLHASGAPSRRRRPERQSPSLQAAVAAAAPPPQSPRAPRRSRLPTATAAPLPREYQLVLVLNYPGESQHRLTRKL